MKKLKFTEKNNSFETVNGKVTFDKSFERYLSLSKVISTYKSIIYVLLFFIIGLIATTIFLLNRNEIKPFLVQVDKQSGAVVSSNILSSNNDLTLTSVELKYFLTKFIIDTNTITKDQQFYELTLQKANMFLNSNSQNKLKDYLKTQDYFKYFNENKTQTTEIISYSTIPQLQNSYQIRFKNKIFNEDGKLVSEKYESGIFKIGRLRTEKAEVLAVNPFKILIEDFTITSEN